jgi:RNA polymerase sigma factor (sigma-70 family)
VYTTTEYTPHSYVETDEPLVVFWRNVLEAGDSALTHETERDENLIRAFRERRAKLRAVARRANAQDEEDLYQDAFVRIVERSKTEEIPKLDNLLRYVVRCLAIDRFRRKTTRRMLTSDEAGETIVDAAADPERSLMGAQRLSRVVAVINTMPEKRREVFLLHRVEELTYRQIATRLGVSIKTVEKHIHLAMRSLSDADE